MHLCTRARMGVHVCVRGAAEAQKLAGPRLCLLPHVSQLIPVGRWLCTRLEQSIATSAWQGDPREDL